MNDAPNYQPHALEIEQAENAALTKQLDAANARIKELEKAIALDQKADEAVNDIVNSQAAHITQAEATLNACLTTIANSDERIVKMEALLREAVSASEGAITTMSGSTPVCVYCGKGDTGSVSTIGVQHYHKRCLDDVRSGR